VRDLPEQACEIPEVAMGASLPVPLLKVVHLGEKAFSRWKHGPAKVSVLCVSASGTP
jgi:hypothetical protein